MSRRPVGLCVIEDAPDAAPNDTIARGLGYG